MTYIEGFLAAVPTADKDAYRTHAALAADVFRDHGALSLTECWGDDVPEGKINSMHTAVMRRPDETVVFGWIVWPSKEVRDAGVRKVSEDPRMASNPMPFDASRMIYGGFEVLLER